MAEQSAAMGHVEKCAQPLQIQRLERSLCLTPYLDYLDRVFKNSSDESEDENDRSGVAITKEERRSDKSRLFNVNNVDEDREVLRNALISDTSEESSGEDGEITEAQFQRMMRQHLHEKKLRKNFYMKSSRTKYRYYGTGLLSNYDKYREDNESETIVPKPCDFLNSDVKADGFKAKKRRKLFKKENSFNDSLDFDDGDSDEYTRDELDDDLDGKFKTKARGRSRRRPEKPKSIEVLNQRRRKLLALIAKKELGKFQRSRTNNHKEKLMSLKKVAQMCTKHWRQKALQSQKNMKETVWRTKRLSREMQSYWKRYERVERDTRRRQEKEAEEQRRQDLEFIEAKRQQRKLNFLITQTELYAHFISKKIGTTSGLQQKILDQLNEEEAPRLVIADDYNCEEMKTTAVRNVERAVNAEQARSRSFDVSLATTPSYGNSDERPQPKMFKGTLKHYQLKGMNWLANLYNEGINGILADEMGLGKTVQSLAFLSHIAEKYAVWGPFLIITPASTLHNWQQEMERFVPDFKVVPYWGNVQERRILRQFWDQKDLHTREASFHVVITSYQLVITDFKYFNRIKWQYLILDEAQAIKSSNSMRWKLLLGFSCRNRLLLSGTPIQNSMAELWALLHFIMPTLFDNHEEFSEWFSKDIEGQAENKTRIDEKHLSRLHLILKPFMLRRIKKDVENELSDKIEVMVYCPLTTRQKLLYSGLKQKIRVEDLLAGISGKSGPGDDPSRNITSNLMNLVMQFRKVCNHPELFERREAWLPFHMDAVDYVIPKLVFEDAMLWKAIPSIRHITHNLLAIHSIENIHRALTGCFGFLRLIGLSAFEAHKICANGILAFWLSLQNERYAAEMIQHRALWDGPDSIQTRLLIAYQSHLLPPNICRSQIWGDLIFTRPCGPKSLIYTHTLHTHHFIPETLEHRVLRSRKQFEKLRAAPADEFLAELPSSTETTPTPSEEPRLGRKPKVYKNSSKNSNDDLQQFLVETIPFVQRDPLTFTCVPTEMPSFLYNPQIKVQGRSRWMYASCRNNSWEALRHIWCSTPDGHDTIWYGHPITAQHHRRRHNAFQDVDVGGLLASTPAQGWSNVIIPDKQTLVADAGKLYVLDGLLKRLKEGGHRVLIYSQMTRMIDLLEEYMWHRKHTYMRLDGSSKISERRDMVADFQARADIFVFLLSTRAGGLGINLTAADTVIFYDSDWNPTVDQQAMDRAHRLGQTKQVTVYRLICKGTIEERMLQRAREKSEIQRMVISGGNFKPDHLKPKEVVSLLLDDEEMEKKYQQKQAERKMMDEKLDTTKLEYMDQKIKSEVCEEIVIDSTSQSTSHSPSRSDSIQPDDSGEGLLVDVDGPLPFSSPLAATNPFNPLSIGSVRMRPPGRGSKRGRPRGGRRGGSNAVRKRAYDSDIKLPGEMFISGESPSTTADDAAKRARGATVKRGPGRPRMKPIGPASQGTRTPRGRGSRGSRARKAQAPLQVPVARTSSNTIPLPRSYDFYAPSE